MNHVTVTTALALSSEQKQAVEKVLAKKKITDYELTEVVDATVLGGVKLVINGQLYDATVRGRLTALQASLMKDNV